MPVRGMSVGEGELLFDGVSFKQASMAQRIEVACAISMLQRPTLRLLRVDEAERLDSKTFKRLLELADAQNFQVFAARVRDGEALQIEIIERGTSQPN